MSAVSNPTSHPLTPAQATAMMEMAKRGAVVDALFIAGETAVAVFGGYAAYSNTNPITGGEISSSWDGLARIGLAGGAALATADVARRSKNLYKNLKILSQ